MPHFINKYPVLATSKMPSLLVFRDAGVKEFNYLILELVDEYVVADDPDGDQGGGDDSEHAGRARRLSRAGSCYDWHSSSRLLSKRYNWVADAYRAYHCDIAEGLLQGYQQVWEVRRAWAYRLC